jgi:molybdopterin-binding protein
MLASGHSKEASMSRLAAENQSSAVSDIAELKSLLSPGWNIADEWPEPDIPTSQPIRVSALDIHELKNLHQERQAITSIGTFFKFLWRIYSPHSIKQETITSIKTIKVRNQFRGKITEIIEGPVDSEVVVETQAGTVTSAITTRSIRDTGLVIGTEVVAQVKATEITIAKP